MREERSSTLTKIRDYKYIEHFKLRINELFRLLYPNEEIQSGEFTFRHGNLRGTSCQVYGNKMYITLDREVMHMNIFNKNIEEEFEALNAYFHYQASNATVYLYPRERSSFDDTPLGI